MAAAGTLKLDDLSGGDSDSEHDLTAPARVLCIISSGGFLRNNVNVALVKAAIASKVGIQGGGGGVDFSDVSLPLVNSAETRDGWVMRAIGGRGPALLGAWAGSGPHSTSVEITPSDGGASGPVRIVVDSVHLPCDVRGDWGAGQLCAAAESLPCAGRFGLGAFSGPSLIVSMFFGDTRLLQFGDKSQVERAHRHDRAIQERILMTEEPGGLAAVAASQGYTAVLLRRPDDGARHAGCGLVPKPLAGKADKECTEGVLARVQFSPAAGTGASTLAPLLLPASSPWYLSGSRDRVAGYKIESNGITEVQTWTDGYVVTRVADTGGVFGWVIAAEGVDATSVRPGLSKAVKPRPPRSQRPRDPRLTEAVEAASRLVRPLCCAPCPAQLRRASGLVRRKAVADSTAYRPTADAEFRLRSGERWAATLCPAGSGCSGQLWPCQVLDPFPGFLGVGLGMGCAGGGGGGGVSFLGGASLVAYAPPLSTEQEGHAAALGQQKAALAATSDGLYSLSAEPRAARGGGRRGRGRGSASPRGSGRGGGAERQPGSQPAGGERARGPSRPQRRPSSTPPPEQAAPPPAGREQAQQLQHQQQGQSAEGTGRPSAGALLMSGCAGGAAPMAVDAQAASSTGGVAARGPEAAGAEGEAAVAALTAGSPAAAAGAEAVGSQGAGYDAGEGGGGEDDAWLFDYHEGGEGAAEEAVASAGEDGEALRRTLFARVKARLRELVSTGHRCMGYDEAAEVLPVLYGQLRADPQLANCANSEFQALADEALSLVRATEGGKQRLAGLLFSAGALPVRPLFKDEEPESPGGLKRRRGDDKEESEVELGEATLMTKARDSLWGATLTGLAVRTGGLSEYSPGFSDEDVHAVAATVAAGVAGTTPAVVEKLLEHGLKFFIRAGQCSARPVNGTKRYFLSFALFGDNPTGPTGAATGSALDPVSEA